MKQLAKRMRAMSPRIQADGEEFGFAADTALDWLFSHREISGPVWER